MESARCEGDGLSSHVLAPGGHPMRLYRSAISLSIATGLILLITGAPPAFGQETRPDTQNRDTGYRPGIRRIASGQKTKLTGRIVRRDAETFSIRDEQDMEVIVRLT